MDNPDLPGLGGSHYYNPDLVEFVEFDSSDPYHIYQPDGSVEINAVPPPCPCPEDVSCRWTDTDYINYACMCDGLWVSAKELRDDPALCGKIRDTCKDKCA